jgi:hypothetical protein
VSTTTSLTVHVPLTVRHRPGRKTIVTLNGAACDASIRTRADPAMVKALARAFRWKRMLSDGRYASISEIAAAEKIDRGYVGSILRLALLAPDIVEAVLNGQQPPEMGLPLLMEPFPLAWNEQRQMLCGQNEVIDGATTARDRRLAYKSTGTNAVPPKDDDTNGPGLEVPMEGHRGSRL